MKVIYYNVMEILEFLLSLFTKGKEDGLSSVINLLKENSFDISKTLKNLSPEQVAPIFQDLMNGKKETDNNYSNKTEKGTAPIENFADKDIVNALNFYFEENPLS